jgi:hypothetical protein
MRRSAFYLAVAIVWAVGTIVAEKYLLLSPDTALAIGMLGTAIIIGRGMWLEHFPVRRGGK